MIDDQHVYPVGDLKPHSMERDCWCRPRIIDCEGGGIVSHNSMDGREKYETGERLPH